MQANLTCIERTLRLKLEQTRRHELPSRAKSRAQEDRRAQAFEKPAKAAVSYTHLTLPTTERV